MWTKTTVATLFFVYVTTLFFPYAANGAVVPKLDYLPFGAERVNVKTGSFDTKHTFTTPPEAGRQEKDIESGLLYYGARYYHPVIGRFTQVDSVVIDNVGCKEFAMAMGNPQLLNGYSYVGNKIYQVMNLLDYLTPADKESFVHLNGVIYPMEV